MHALGAGVHCDRGWPAANASTTRSKQISLAALWLTLAWLRPACAIPPAMPLLIAACLLVVVVQLA
jgi:hypothetical protein